jgi:hypothetical protein
MDPQRKGEIAYKVLKRILVQRFSMANVGEFGRTAGTLAKATGISRDEILAFGEEIIKEVFEEQMSAGFASREKATG